MGMSAPQYMRLGGNGNGLGGFLPMPTLYSMARCLCQAPRSRFDQMGRGMKSETWRKKRAVPSLLPPRAAGEDDVGAGEWDAGDQGGFERQGAEVFRLEVVDV